MNNTRYFDLSTDEKLALDSEGVRRATEIEAAHRGVAVPIELPEILTASAYSGFHVPAEAVGLYEVVIPGSYDRLQPTGLCYRTEEEAVRALAGAVCVKDEGYGDTAKRKIVEGDLSVRKIFVTLRPARTVGCKTIETYREDSEEFYALSDEIQGDLRVLRQARYDAGVAAAKKAKYLQLAGGDETVAKSFWSGIEKTEWPLV